MAKDFQQTEPTVRIIFAPEHIGQDGVIQLAAFYDFRRELVGNQNDNRRNNDVSLYRLLDENSIQSLRDNASNIIERRNNQRRKKGKEANVSFAGVCCSVQTKSCNVKKGFMPFLFVRPQMMPNGMPKDNI